MAEQETHHSEGNPESSDWVARLLKDMERDLAELKRGSKFMYDSGGVSSGWPKGEYGSPTGSHSDPTADAAMRGSGASCRMVRKSEDHIREAAYRLRSAVAAMDMALGLGQ